MGGRTGRSLMHGRSKRRGRGSRKVDDMGGRRETKWLPLFCRPPRPFSKSFATSRFTRALYPYRYPPPEPRRRCESATDNESLDSAPSGPSRSES